MVTFKKIMVNNKWYGSWYAYNESKNTKVFISQDKNGTGDEFYCMVEPESKHYGDFEPCTRKSLNAAKNYVKSFFSKK
jgi:hypothetical protein